MTDEFAALPACLHMRREHLGHDVPTFATLINSTPRTIRKHEFGSGPKIRTGTLLKISDATGCSIDWLMTGRRNEHLLRDDAKPMLRSPDVYRNLDDDALAA